MNRLNSLFAAVVIAAIVAVAPAANAAPTVHFLGAGSSAMYTGFAIAASNDLAHGGANSVHHFTIKGSCSVQTCAQLIDTQRNHPERIRNTVGGLYLRFRGLQR